MIDEVLKFGPDFLFLLTAVHIIYKSIVQKDREIQEEIKQTERSLRRIKRTTNSKHWKITHITK